MEKLAQRHTVHRRIPLATASVPQVRTLFFSGQSESNKEALCEELLLTQHSTLGLE